MLVGIEFTNHRMFWNPFFNGQRKKFTFYISFGMHVYTVLIAKYFFTVLKDTYNINFMMTNYKLM